MPEINFHVTRFNPESDPAPYVRTYRIPVREGMTVLDGLHYIKDNVDPTLAWRYSCRMGVCGSCGMLLNGRPTLACNTQILHIADRDLTVGPLPNFDIIRDLVPDLLSMFQKHRSVKPYVVRGDENEINDAAGEFYQSPEELEAYLQFTFCIKCGCCMAACPTLATDARYLGPMPLTAGQTIGMADSLIAGIALAQGRILLTRNRRHFERVSGLELAELSDLG